jgi:hypothetical protein
MNTGTVRGISRSWIESRWNLWDDAANRSNADIISAGWMMIRHSSVRVFRDAMFIADPQNYQTQRYYVIHLLYIRQMRSRLE